MKIKSQKKMNEHKNQSNKEKKDQTKQPYGGKKREGA